MRENAEPLKTNDTLAYQAGQEPRDLVEALVGQTQVALCGPHLHRGDGRGGQDLD